VKNQKFLLELLPELRKRGDFRLLLLGGGPDRSRLLEIIKGMKLEEFVIMPGNVEEIWKYYSAMDAFCLPSRYEGMPLALLEARCSGLPCFVSDTVAWRDPGTVGLPLGAPGEWVRELSAVRGRIPGEVPDIRQTMGAIYQIYGRAVP